MTGSTGRHSAMLIGLLVGLSVLLLVGLPAAWNLAERHLPEGGSVWPSAQAHSAQVAPGSSVEITGTSRTLLRPGGSFPINLGFVNRDPDPITLRHVRLTITDITAPNADSDHPCTRADFWVRPMRAGTLVLPGDTSTDLVRLGVPTWQWPHLTMRNLPVNQDGCKGASLTLDYLGYRAWSG